MQRNVEVRVRVRPPKSGDATKRVVALKGDRRISIVQPCASHTGGAAPEDSKPAFDFDRVHQGESQKALYESAVAPLVDGVLHGFNATVLAYGQSASGKTYTMGCGADLAGDDEGIVQRAAQQLLAGAVTNAEWDDAQTAEVHMAYVEIYNEDLRDLLAPPAPAKPEVALAVRETPQGEVVVVGATEIRCRTIDDVRLLLRTGAARRATGSTALNERSSRSHAIVTLTVTKTQLVSEPDADEPRQFSVVKSKIHCADPRPASSSATTS